MVPPILRGVDIGAGFGAELMKNAYNFMNSVTSTERRKLKEVFINLFVLYPEKFTDFEIGILEYIGNNEMVRPELLPDLTSNERRQMAGYKPDETATGNTQILAQVLGVGGTQALTAIVVDVTLQPEQKVQILIKLFSFTEEEARLIITPKI
jgi:hypothetical protein